MHSKNGMEETPLEDDLISTVHFGPAGAPFPPPLGLTVREAFRTAMAISTTKILRAVRDVAPAQDAVVFTKHGRTFLFIQREPDPIFREGKVLGLNKNPILHSGD